ncbi:MAG TPA: MBL fold metallo-hydrolase [Verrucomicrobiae bacterium]|nr:MBL fold metallo-hydrolase [Verrucomicrobiae bacterium]
MTAQRIDRGLSFQIFTGQDFALANNAVLICGERDAILIDTCLVLSDAARLVEMIRASGKALRAVCITHAHPDHYFGNGVVQQAFPSARFFARQGVIDFMQEYRAKLVHWREMFGDEMPRSIPMPEPLIGSQTLLEGHEIRFVDLPVCETVHATAYYVPSAKAVIAGDLVYSGMHHYMADTNHPESWIEALNLVRRLGPLERVFPGHGPVGGAELLDASEAWLRDYMDVAKPGVRFVDIAKEMTRRYPNHGLAILLWLTRGPGFGLAGAKEIGVPPQLLGGS